MSFGNPIRHRQAKFKISLYAFTPTFVGEFDDLMRACSSWDIHVHVFVDAADANRSPKNRLSHGDFQI